MDQIRNILLEVEELKTKKQFQECISLLQRSLTKYSDDYRLYEELADIYLYTNNNEKAIAAIDFSLTLNPKSATGNYLKGFILLGQDKVTESISYLETSNSLF